MSEFLDNIGFTDTIYRKDNTQAVGSLLLRIIITSDSFKLQVNASILWLVCSWTASLTFISILALSSPYCAIRSGNSPLQFTIDLFGVLA